MHATHLRAARLLAAPGRSARVCGRLPGREVSVSRGTPAPAAVPAERDSTTIRPTVSQAELQRALEAAQASGRQGAEATAVEDAKPKQRPLTVLIAGAGIGGLVLAVALLKRGFAVKVFERDLTAIRGEGKYRGPIQIQSNALGALEAIDAVLADEIMNLGCITGDRINGLCDGVTGDWYVKFDTFHPAADNGLPVTRVISRVALQNVLSKATEKLGGPILGNSHVVSYSTVVDPDSGLQQAQLTLEDGSVHTGDILVGADGIRSKVRKQLLGEAEFTANYSGYTCYTGISDFTPFDIEVVGYRVFLGNAQYFVSSDVGGGKMQWYAFHKEPAGGSDVDGKRKERLLQIFGHWCDNVVDLIKATPEEDILRRDIFDRPPIFKWSEGRTVLLGDSAHAMQPNLGQGGCMAIEDAYELASILTDGMDAVGDDRSRLDVDGAFRSYQAARQLRASAIHGMAGMAAFMASTYKAYLGEGLPGPLAELTRFKIPHPGRVAGQVVMKLTMPAVLGWVLGGNVEKVQRSRRPHSRIADQPHGFREDQFPEFMVDDDAIIRASSADWLLLTQRVAASREDVSADQFSTSQAKGVYMAAEELVVGSADSDGAGLLVAGPGVAAKHATVWRTEAPAAQGGKPSHSYHLKDLGAGAGTWVNGVLVPPGGVAQLKWGDVVEFGSSPAPEVFKVKLQHTSLRTEELCGHKYSTLMVGSGRGRSGVLSLQP